jgi:hypothetical protein
VVRFVNDRSASEIYAGFLPVLNSRRVELLDNPRLLTQLAGLECRTTRGGKESIDHAPRGGHDDLINVVAVASLLATANTASPATRRRRMASPREPRASSAVTFWHFSVRRAQRPR